MKIKILGGVLTFIGAALFAHGLGMVVSIWFGLAFGGTTIRSGGYDALTDLMIMEMEFMAGGTWLWWLGNYLLKREKQK